MGIRLRLTAYTSIFIEYIPSNRSLQNEENKPLDVSGIDFKISNEYMKILPTRQVRSTSPFEVLKVITDVVMDIFIVNDTKLVWNMPSIKGFVDLFVWDLTKHFEEIQFDSEELEDSEALKFLLEEVSTETSKIDIRNSTFQCDIPFKSPILRLYDHSNCFKMDSFLKMECQDVEMEVNRMSSGEINSLLKCWINGGLVNLEFLEVTISRFRDSPINEEVIFKGIQKTRYNGPLPPRPFRQRDRLVMRPSYGWENHSFHILRKSDNRRATVGMNHRILGIAVWP